MESNSQTIETLNDLIMINNDRIAGYERLQSETKEIETDLRALFQRMADQSREYVAQLSDEVTKLGAEPASGTLASGKLYRFWMDIRAALSNDNRMAVLANAETGEDAAQKAYEEALGSDTLTGNLAEIVTIQKTQLLSSHDSIKRQRDEQKDVGRYPLTT